MLSLSLSVALSEGGASRTSDTTAPTLPAISFDTDTLLLTLVEASGAATVVWATSDTGVTPTFTVVGGWVGTTYETGSFAATVGAISETITLTTTPAGSRKLTVYAYDASENLSAAYPVTITV